MICRKIKRILPILVLSLGCGIGSIGCASRPIVVQPMGDEIQPVSTGSVLVNPSGEEVWVEKPSYLITEEYMLYLMKVTLESLE